MNTVDPQTSVAAQLANQRVCVVGLGLMGGSLALALRGHVRSLCGVDRDPATLARARELVPGLVTDDIERGMAQAQLVVLAAPVRANVALIERVGPSMSPGSRLLDLSSTKHEIVAAMNQLPADVHAVGGHPMCGKESAGIEHAEAGLFRGQTFALCRTERTDGATEQLALALVRALGAHALWINPTDHDRAVARVSHLPYLLAAGLVTSAGALPAEAMRLAASGYRDTSRLAASDPEMMTDVLLTNRAHVLEALQAAGEQLDRFAELIQAGRTDQLRRVLGASQADRQRWRGPEPTTGGKSGD